MEHNYNDELSYTDDTLAAIPTYYSIQYPIIKPKEFIVRCIIHIPNTWDLKDNSTIKHIMQCITGTLSTKVAIPVKKFSFMGWPNMDYQSLLDSLKLQTVLVIIEHEANQGNTIVHDEVVIGLIYPYGTPEQQSVCNTFLGINKIVCPKSKGYIDKLTTKIDFTEDDCSLLVGLYRYPHSVYPTLWKTIGDMQNRELKKKLQESFSMGNGKR